MKFDLKRTLSTIKEIYVVSFSYIKHTIVNKLLTKIIKVQPKEYKISISQLPPDEQTKILVNQLMKEKEEKVLLEQKVKELEEQLDKLRQKALAKVLEEIAKEEKEKGKPSVSLYDVLRRVKMRGILPFKKPPVVYDITMKKLGYLNDIILHPSGGFAFVIDKGKGNYITTPPFSSLWEAVFHAENISQQLPDVLILNVVEMEDGRLIKVPEIYINSLYKGEPAEKIIAHLKEQINKLANEAETAKLMAELVSVQNVIEKIDKDVAHNIAVTSLNLFENMMKTASNVLIPTTLAATQANTTLHLELNHQRSLAEHAKELADQYAARLKKLEDSLAPEKIIMIQDRLISRLEELTERLATITKELKEAKETKPEETTPKE